MQSGANESTTPRDVRFGVVALFGAVSIALLLGVVGLTLSIRPELDALVEITNDHSHAVEVLARLQASLTTLRLDASTRRVAALEARVTDARRWVAAFRPFAGTPTEREGLVALEESLDAAGHAVAQTGDASAAGDERRLAAAGADLLAATRRADDAAQRLEVFNVGEVQDASHRAHAALVTLVWLAALAAVLVVGAALLLLHRALGTLARYQHAVERHAEELDAFSGRTAHELRTPLAALGLAVGIAQRSAQPQALERAREQVMRMSDTIEALLQFARASGRPEAGARSSVAAVVDEVATDAEAVLAHQGMAIVRDLQAPADVAMSTSHLRTVLMNLVVNAVKHGSAGPGSVVMVSARRTGARVALSVRDWGRGIPSDVKPHVFEPLFRASRGTDGYGLGLATVKRLVEAYGGSVMVESSVGLGTAFVIDLPPAAGA
ncbi:MAG: sensor histidine kinase [Anaeromyxobacteraceae bacterium]